MRIKSLMVAGLMTVAASLSHAATVSDVGTFAGGTDFVSSGGGAIVDAIHPRYVPNSATSEWVWDANPAQSPVTFTHIFNLTGFDHTTASLSGLWGVDNVGTAYLNGTAISFIPYGYPAFESLTAYGAAAGFIAGFNALSFYVENTGAYSPSNPAAFRAEATITASPVPLPAGGLLLITGLGAFGALRRRKKAS